MPPVRNNMIPGMRVYQVVNRGAYRHVVRAY
jgi:hypothetical protein